MGNHSIEMKRIKWRRERYTYTFDEQSTKKRIHKLEGRYIEITQTETQKKDTE